MGIVFGQSRILLRFGFDPGTNIFGFCGVFWYSNNSMTNYEGTKRCPVLCGSEIWVMLCVIASMNNMLLCVKNMLIYAI